MKNSNDNIAAFDYLLGLSSDEETERIDELCFIDDATRETVAAAEAELMDMYARGELYGRRLDCFRARFLNAPSRREKIEFSRALAEFVDKNARETAENTTISWLASLVMILRRPAFALTAAAVFLLVLSGGIWWFAERSRQPAAEIAKETAPESNATVQHDLTLPVGEIAPDRSMSKNDDQDSKTPPPANKSSQTNGARKTPPQTKSDATPHVRIASIVLLPLTRGTRELPTLKIPSDARRVNVTTRLEFDDYPAYTAALIDPTDGSTLWTSGRLISRKGAVNVTIPANLLKSRIYSISVTGEQAGTRENTGDYPFRVVR
jgi:hypothetical protein